MWQFSGCIDGSVVPTARRSRASPRKPQCGRFDATLRVLLLPSPLLRGHEADDAIHASQPHGPPVGHTPVVPSGRLRRARASDAVSVLLAVPRADAAPGAAILERGRRSLRDQGFGEPTELAAADARLLWSPSPQDPDGSRFCREFDDGFACAVGTLFYDGRCDGEALERLWRDAGATGRPDWDRLQGNFVVALARGGALWLFCDRLGMLKLYEGGDGAVLSTSWLACARALPASRPDPLGVADYVFTGASHGPRTPLEAVRVADPEVAIEVVGGGRERISGPDWWLAPEPYADPRAALADAADLLRDRARTIAANFDGRVNCALSGGFDSRLILASLLSVQAEAKLHVYGVPGDPDVALAQAIARGMGLALTAVDKSATNADLPQLDATAVWQRMEFFDGIPIDGIFDRGADVRTRLAQAAGGAVALNGGGGEVLRNFFYLHDRPFGAMQLVDAFYSGFRPDALRDPGLLGEYRRYLADGIERCAGARGPLDRRRVELVYPLFRNRYWTSRNNSVAARIGHFLTPLLDPEFVRLAMRLPLAWKDYGRFESRLLCALSPRLGEFPLSYGFTPAAGPGPAYRARMWLQHRRPTWLRGRSAAIKAALGRLPAPAARPEWQRIVGAPSACAGLVDASRLTDSAQLARLFTLEFAFARLGAGS